MDQDDPRILFPHREGLTVQELGGRWGVSNWPESKIAVLNSKWSRLYEKNLTFVYASTMKAQAQYAEQHLPAAWSISAGVMSSDA